MLDFDDRLRSLKRFCVAKSTLTFILLTLICLPPVDANFRLCGVKLTATLKMVCKHQMCGGNMLTKQKRSYIHGIDELIYLRHIPRETSDQFLTRITRSSGGIADECCSKKCNLAYLRTYCCNEPTHHRVPLPVRTTTTPPPIDEDEEFEMER